MNQKQQKVVDEKTILTMLALAVFYDASRTSLLGYYCDVCCFFTHCSRSK